MEGNKSMYYHSEKSMSSNYQRNTGPTSFQSDTFVGLES